jgi:uncharacterized protein
VKEPLPKEELMLLTRIFEKHPEISAVKLFGSRAKGTNALGPDVDLALCGEVSPLYAEAVAAELDDLPLPYRFDVQPLRNIKSKPLLDHNERVGIEVYRRD